MTAKLELIGFDSGQYLNLKETIRSYLSVKKLDFNMVENDGTYRNDIDMNFKAPAIRFKNQLIFFPKHDDIKTGLSKLHHLIHESSHGTKKTCLNCANCRCRKDK